MTNQMNNIPIIGLSMGFGRLEKYEQFYVRDKYIDAVFESGGLPLPLPCTKELHLINACLAKIDALIFIGGADYPASFYGETDHPSLNLMHPRRSQADLALIQQALLADIPILGICAGCQLINIALGGKIIQHIANFQHHTNENYHPVTITGGKWLPQIFGQTQVSVNSTHHQALDPQHLGKGLSPVAFSDDGIIEAIELDSPNMVLGLQWHPERINDEEHRKAVFEFLIQHSV